MRKQIGIIHPAFKEAHIIGFWQDGKTVSPVILMTLNEATLKTISDLVANDE